MDPIVQIYPSSVEEINEYVAYCKSGTWIWIVILGTNKVDHIVNYNASYIY